MFPSSSNSVLQKLDMEPACQVMRVPLAFHLYAKKNGRIPEFFVTLSRENSVLVMDVKKVRYVQKHDFGKPLSSYRVPIQGHVHSDIFCSSNVFTFSVCAS